ncbi:MAG: LptF/LptG family permease [candidate division KSB1 bacterium]|nr:LptF/LptG family permease [candidate division KSB1 bacterium]MDZ7368479.1 LptF/LptG family permease [candidate division KSB1 bacterium]MDZ7406205.1 LptF/LptG family permease [candidate division KSB1 bacterium]
MRSFILARYILREHLGPFCLSFALITLIFLLDLVFRHLSRMLSKGLPLAVVFEFFGLNLAWIVATAVPMAVLTAVLMAFGRLAADQEITAMQAGGLSLCRLVAPVFLVTGLLALGLIWFNNHILPDFNYRARLLASDIARKKPGVRIEPGVWFHDIPNYSLLVKALEDSAAVSKVRGIIVNDNTDPNLQRTISAHAGLMQPTPGEGLLLLTLFDGEIQEMNIQKLEEFRRVKFAKHAMSIKVDDSMFWQRSDSDTRTDREKSVPEMWQEVQEHRARLAWLEQRINLIVGIDFYHRLGRAFSLVPDSLVHLLISPRPPENPDSPFFKKEKSGQQKKLLAQISQFILEKQRCEDTAQVLLVEIHKKYAIPAACLVFVLVGAPLGVLARRGGVATGAGLSLGFFLLYWAFLIGGEDLADRYILSPFAAMWSANFFVGAMGVFVFRRISLGRLSPMSFSIMKWLSRFSFNGFFKKFRRPYSDDEHTTSPEYPPEPEEKQPPFPDFFDEEEKPAEPFPPTPQPELPPAPPASPPPERPSPASPPVILPQLEMTQAPEILRNFTNRTRADLVLFADRNGVPHAYCKNPAIELPPRTDLEMIAKLAAGQMAVTREISHSLGDDGSFHSIFKEGGQRNVFICQISEEFNLVAVADKTIALGLVQIHAREAVKNFRKMLEMV